MTRKKTTVVKPKPAPKPKPFTVTEDDFETQYDDDHKFPFFEDENGNWVIGYGHTDRAEFAAGVNEYDALANAGTMFSELRPYTSDDVVHAYAIATKPGDSPADPEYWSLNWHEVTDKTRGSFPVTLVQR